MTVDAAQKLDEDWPKLLALLPSGWEAKAKELGALKFGRRFSGPESLLRTLLMYLSADCSMVETAERARAGDWVELSDVGLLKRVNNSGAWLGWITEQLIQPPHRGNGMSGAARATITCC
ncbi:hypothetical protein ACN1C3_27920 [Pseudomonas sp. H11T01]|uniref:hypothetical protein n=1 Tax=Pseudomonas sp. H11T01 TaxID=3402749 RepID=UPI003AD501BB